MKKRKGWIIKRTSCLREEESRAAAALSLLCQEQDRSSVSYPAAPEEADMHYLLMGGPAYDGCPRCGEKSLLAALSFLPYGDERSADCIAFTAPKYRRQGFFSALLGALLEDYADYDLFFPVSGNSRDTLAALDASGAKHSHDELMMRAQLAPPKLPLENPCFPQSPYGTFAVTPVSDEAVCLHHAEIFSEYRGRGFGTAMISGLLEELAACGIRRVLLHVSGDNAPAVALYRKTGFQTIESLSYYLKHGKRL